MEISIANVEKFLNWVLNNFLSILALLVIIFLTYRLFDSIFGRRRYR